MKKSYNNPTIKVVKIQPMQMIAASTPEGINIKSSAADKSRGVLSREARFSEWDEDEE